MGALQGMLGFGFRVLGLGVHWARCQAGVEDGLRNSYLARHGSQRRLCIRERAGTPGK